MTNEKKKPRRRWPWILALLFGLPVLCMLGFGAYLGTALKTQGKRLAFEKRVVGVLEFSYTWILRTPKGAILIDSGNDKDAKAIKAELKTMGLTPDQVHTILLTHGHVDHISGMLAFPKAKVWIGPGETQVVARKVPIGGVFQRTLASLTGPFPLGSRKLQELKDGQRLTVDGEQIQVVHTPGHTRGSVVYLWRGILFAGDTVMSAKGGVQLLPSVMMEDVDLARSSLEKKILPLSFQTMADGHVGLTLKAHAKVSRFLKAQR